MAFIKLFSYHYARHRRHVHLTVAGIIIIAGIVGAVSLLHIKEPAIAQANQPPHKPSTIRIINPFPPSPVYLTTSTEKNDAPMGLDGYTSASLSWQGGDPDPGDVVSYSIYVVASRQVDSASRNELFVLSAVPGTTTIITKEMVTLLDQSHMFPMSQDFGELTIDYDFSNNKKGGYYISMLIVAKDAQGNETSSDWHYFKTGDNCYIEFDPVGPIRYNGSFRVDAFTNYMPFGTSEVQLKDMTHGTYDGLLLGGYAGYDVSYSWPEKPPFVEFAVVEDNTGVSPLCSRKIYGDYANYPPRVEFRNFTPTPLSGSVPLTVTFESNIADEGDGSYLRDWDLYLGDGTPGPTGGPFVAGTIFDFPTETHTYTKGGSWTVVWGAYDSTNKRGEVISEVNTIAVPTAPDIKPYGLQTDVGKLKVNNIDFNNVGLNHAIFNNELGKYHTGGSLSNTEVWIVTPTEINLLPVPGQQYTFKTKVENTGVIPQLISNFGPSSVGVATWPVVPGIPAVTNNTTGQTVIVDPKNNHSTVEYRIEVLSSAYANTSAACGSAGKCVPPSGGAVASCTASEQWGIYSGFGSASGVGATGLTDGQIYGYRVMARSVNGDGTYNTLSTCSSKVDLQYSPGGPPPPGPAPTGGGALPVRLSVIKEVVSPADGVVTTPGATVSYKITVTNWGTEDAAQNYKITDILPPGFTNPRNFVGANPVAPVIAGRKLVWDLAPAQNPLLKDGGQLVITYDATAP